MWQSRKLTYREKGTVRFTQRERRSYALMLDLRIVSVLKVPFQNLKSNPTQSFYGKATVFGGSVPYELLEIPFPRYRIFSLRNEQAATTYNQLALAADGNRQLTDLAEVVEEIWSRLQGLQLAPLLQHRPNFVKFVGLPFCQFEFTVWRLEFEGGVGFQFPAADPDPTRGEDQYYEPKENDISDPYQGNEPESEIPDRVDPRDFGDSGNNSANTGTGLTSFEFSVPSSNGFSSGGGGRLGYPGFLSSRDLPDGRLTVDWVDNEGNRSAVTVTSEDSISVRNFRIVLDDGTEYAPLSDSFTNER